jgi:hypothetical protein
MFSFSLEARMYFNESISDGFIEPGNEIILYIENTLKSIINEYSDKNSNR